MSGLDRPPRPSYPRLLPLAEVDWFPISIRLVPTLLLFSVVSIRLAPACSSLLIPERRARFAVGIASRWLAQGLRLRRGRPSASASRSFSFSGSPQSIETFQPPSWLSWSLLIVSLMLLNFSLQPFHFLLQSTSILYCYFNILSILSSRFFHLLDLL